MKGRFFEGLAHPDVQNINPTYTFIPSDLIKNGLLDETKYVQSHWAAINCAANWEKGIGSHLFPNLEKPLAKENIPQNFLKNLEKYLPKSLGKAAPVKTPGKPNQLTMDSPS